MTQQEMVAATKSNNLISIPQETSYWREKTNSYKLSSDLHIGITACVCHLLQIKQINKCNLKRKRIEEMHVYKDSLSLLPCGTLYYVLTSLTRCLHIQGLGTKTNKITQPHASPYSTRNGNMFF